MSTQQNESGHTEDVKFCPNIRTSFPLNGQLDQCPKHLLERTEACWRCGKLCVVYGDGTTRASVTTHHPSPCMHNVNPFDRERFGTQKNRFKLHAQIQDRTSGQGVVAGNSTIGRSYGNHVTGTRCARANIAKKL